MTKIQDRIMQGGDQDKATSVDEKPSVFESTPSYVGPSGEPLKKPDTAYGRPTLDATSPLKTFFAEFEMAGYPASVDSKTRTPYGRSFWEDFEAQRKKIKERPPEGLFVFKGGPNGGPVPITPQ